MKKKIVLISVLVIIIVSIISIKQIYAADNNDHSLIYDIEDMNFDSSNGTITFEGWAFIHEYHNNYAGSTTKISIYAKGVNGKVVYADVKYNSEKDRTLYQAMCTRNKENKCYEDYDKATCNGNKNSQCRYDSVGFTATISIEDIINTIGTDTKVTFILDLENKTTRNGKSVTTNKYTNIAVDNTSTNLENGNQEGTYNGKDYTIKTDGITDKLTIRANWARVVDEAGNYILYNEKQIKWIQNETYQMQGKITSENNVRQIDGLKMYKLSYVRSGNSAYPGNTESGYAYSSWITLEGKIIMEFDAKEEDNDDDDDYKPKACQKSNDGNLNGLECDDEGLKEQTIVKKVKASKSMNTEIIRTIEPDDEEYDDYSRIRNSKKEENCNSIYVTEIQSQVGITQTGIPDFSISTTSIYSGGGFYFNASYSGTASYELCDNLEITVEEEYIESKCVKPDWGKKTEWVLTYDDYDDVCEYTREIKVGRWFENEDGNDERCTEDNMDYYDPESGKCIEIAITEKYEYCDKEENTYTCSNPTDCEEDFEIFAEIMASKYIRKGEPTVDDFVNYSPNTNVVGGSKHAIETWTDVRNYDNVDAWYPNEELTYTATLNLNKACINRFTFEIRYTDEECNDETEMDKGKLIFVPIEYPEKDFNVVLKVSNISIIKGMTWKLSYKCGPSCYQKMYKITPTDSDDDDDDDGGGGSGGQTKITGFAYIYRPIDLDNPFPQVVDENREPGENWTLFLNDPLAVANKLNRNEEGLEYETTLTPADIQNIRNYNKSNGYFDLASSLSKNGKSSFLDDIVAMKTRTNNYNSLGECTKDCWVGEN